MFIFAIIYGKFIQIFCCFFEFKLQNINKAMFYFKTSTDGQGESGLFQDLEAIIQLFEKKFFIKGVLEILLLNFRHQFVHVEPHLVQKGLSSSFLDLNVQMNDLTIILKQKNIRFGTLKTIFTRIASIKLNLTSKIVNKTEELFNISKNFQNHPTFQLINRGRTVKQHLIITNKKQRK